MPVPVPALVGDGDGDATANGNATANGTANGNAGKRYTLDKFDILILNAILKYGRVKDFKHECPR